MNEVHIRSFFENEISGDWGEEEKNQEYTEMVTCIRGTDLEFLNSGYSVGAPRRFVKKSSLEKKMLSPENIIIEISGGSTNQSTGRNAIIKKNYFYPIVCSNFCRALKVSKEYDPYFVYYSLQNIYNAGIFFNFEGKTSGIKNLDLDTCFDKISVPFFKKNIQCKIASILKSLDKKIEQNNRINIKLESMAKLIYEYWFVQFDFPDKNGMPYKSSGGKMTYNEELNNYIPEEWDVAELMFWIENDENGDWGKEKSQGNYKTKVYCIRGTDINGLNGKGKVNAPERYILKKNSRKILKTGDLIVEISGGSPTQSTGRLGYVIDATFKRFNNPLICSNFCRTITLTDKKYIYNFIQLWNRLYNAGVLFGWEGKTSGIKNLLFESFISNYLQPVPEYSVVEKYYEKVDPIYNKIQHNLKENEKLAQLRDWLLPMLMNGQVTVN